MAKVTIIDDDDDFAAAATAALRACGHHVEVLADASTALSLMEQSPPDVVILDVMFPDNAHGGFDIARAMRHQSQALRKVPVLVLSAINARFPLGFSVNDIDDYWLPVSDFLEKPVDLTVLVRKVGQLAGGAADKSAQ